MRIVRGFAGLLGELLVTFGVVLLLFVGWQLWWTDVTADADAAAVVATLEQRDAAPGSGWVEAREAEPGDVFAIIRIPRFGRSYARPVYQGTSREVLMRGVGHYEGTARPGEVGNFAVAGHRTTYGKPFNRIAELRPGDAVLIETEDSWFVYRVTGHDVVLPTQVSVVLPVPDRPGARATKAMLTMTSCHPEFSARERYVVHAELEASYPHERGVPADVLEVSG